MCVCVIPLKFCIVLFHARQILMPQPILIAPRGPHRFIPSGEGASPSPFGPLNARGCVHEPPCGGPPWPPLLPGPRKQKIRVRSVCHTFFSEISRPCAPYIRLRLRVFFCIWLFWLWFFTKDTLYSFAVDGYNSKLLLLLLRGGGDWGNSFIPYTFVNMCCLSCSLFLSSSVHFTHISFSQISLFGPHLLAFKPFTNLKNASNSLPNTP